MAASVQINLTNGTTTTPSVTSDVTTIVLGNANSATQTTTANPITAGTNSYEQYFQADLTALNGAISVSDFVVYLSGTMGADATLMYGQTATFATPVNTASTVATAAIPTSAGSENLYIGGAAGNSLTAAGTTDYGVLQIQTTSSATAGVSSGLSLVVQYTEVA